MNKLFDTTMVIEEAKMTVKKRKFFTITLIFLAVFLLGSMLTSLLSGIPSSIYLMQSGAIDELAKYATNDELYMQEADRIISELPQWLNGVSLIATAGCIIAAIGYCTKYERRRLFTMGIVKKAAVPEYFSGLGIGLGMFAIAYGIMILSGQSKFIGFNAEASIPLILLFFVGYLIQGMSEELLFRGYYMVSAATAGHVSVAVFASSVLFSVMHLGNNDVSALAIVNIFLFGVFAALYFLRRGSIWGIAALHSMWNFAQGNIFGCNVSGNTIGDSVMITENITENGIFNGGGFGPEGGLAVTIVLFIGIAVLLFMKNKDVEAEIDFNKEFYSAI